ncbi:MAG: InlB B-repeat-containing protein [Methanomassiliicoccaceae archaeon]|jgi:uncharacterized repeat protein (TIGR02543 family)|nr:InlB B-repeat-containing protein [Methanomassiliicoccaceae archaeon]
MKKRSATATDGNERSSGNARMKKGLLISFALVFVLMIAAFAVNAQTDGNDASNGSEDQAVGADVNYRIINTVNSGLVTAQRLAGTVGTNLTAANNGGVNGTGVSPQLAIEAIRHNAAGSYCSIQFGNGSTALAITWNTVPDPPYSAPTMRFNNEGGTWGDIDLTGILTGDNNVRNGGFGMLEFNTGGTVTIMSAAAFSISGSTTAVLAPIVDMRSGTLNINGSLTLTTTSQASTAVLMAQSGTVNINNGGRLQSNAPVPNIFSDPTCNATVNVYDGASITNTNTLTTVGIIRGYGILHSGDNILNIYGGTISTNVGGAAIRNNAGSGAINISGGTVTSMNANATLQTLNPAVSPITISNDANITNTGAGIPILIGSSNVVSILGGSVQTNSNNISVSMAVPSGAGASVILGGSPTIDKIISVYAGRLSTLTGGPNEFVPAGNYNVVLADEGTFPAGKGKIVVVDGKRFFSSFTYVNEPPYELVKNANNLILNCGCDLCYNCDNCIETTCCGCTACEPCLCAIVIFDTNGGSPDPDSQRVAIGDLVALPVPPSKPGNSFNGWYPTSDCTGPEWIFGFDTVTGDMKLYAAWAPDGCTCTNFCVCGGCLDCAVTPCGASDCTCGPCTCCACTNFCVCGGCLDCATTPCGGFGCTCGPCTCCACTNFCVCGGCLDCSGACFGCTCGPCTCCACTNFCVCGGCLDCAVTPCGGFGCVCGPCTCPPCACTIVCSICGGCEECDGTCVACACVPCDCVTVTVRSEPGRTFTYTMGGGAPEDITLVTSEYKIKVGKGMSFTITASEIADWSVDGVPEPRSIMISRGSVDSDMTLEATFPSDPDDPIPVIWIAIAFLGLIFLLIFLDDDDGEVFGKVRWNGKGVFGVVIGYTVNGSERKTVTTDKDGDYSISAEEGDTVAITDVSKGKSSATELPPEIRVGNGRTKADFEL